jgi:glutathione S-transferase
MAHPSPVSEVVVKLMYAPTSPFVRRARAVAIELGLEGRLELEPVQVAPGRPNAEYAESVNPLRKIPALVLDDGATVLVDSSVICQYLDDLAGGGRVIPMGADRWRILSQQAIALGMTDAMVLIRYETSLRPDALRWPEYIVDQQDRFWAGLEWFERRAEHALSVPEGPVDVSQLALACCLGYVDFRFPDLGWPTRAARVSRWYQTMLRRPSLAQTDPRLAA